MAGSGLIDRRDFLQTGLKLGIGAMVLINLPLISVAESGENSLVILHTNDVHSRIEPFPMDGSKLQGKGGFSPRARLIREIREKYKNLLILDSGDILQGTPYFNRFHGELEFRLMSEMGYHAACIGNHDFDGGIENLAALAKSATFPLLCANYDFHQTPLDGVVKPYVVMDSGNIRTGIYGLGIELKGLVPDKLFGAVRYLDPIEKALETEEILKNQEKCDFIICLSHLGFSYEGSKVSDVIIARETCITGLILGGHTHTFMDRPDYQTNKKGQQVCIIQNGWGGVNMGFIKLEKDSKKICRINTVNSLSVC